jgi:hypothetical protein
VRACFGLCEGCDVRHRAIDSGVSGGPSVVTSGSGCSAQGRLAALWRAARGEASSPAPRVTGRRRLEGELAFEDMERLIEVMPMERRPSSSDELDDGDVAVAVFTSEQHDGYVFWHSRSLQRPGLVVMSQVAAISSGTIRQ